MRTWFSVGTFRNRSRRGSREATFVLASLTFVLGLHEPELLDVAMSTDAGQVGRSLQHSGLRSDMFVAEFVFSTAAVFLPNLCDDLPVVRSLEPGESSAVRSL